MTYDLAVREGDRPPDGRRARRTFRDLYERYPGGEIEVAPSERITAYVDALPERWVRHPRGRGGDIALVVIGWPKTRTGPSATR
ncbi:MULTISPECIES: hypothetical protein [Streptomyces]|uniref:hypothetical protein n=1 Tax=Streptomyces TaxID=1883 RepID=UPI00224DBBB5|nr:hypothetical protein [Streptomyces sp. NBC_00160]MCX5305179.1 hypothetical protein [Streptomyces sp. NBC_00160]